VMPSFLEAIRLTDHTDNSEPEESGAASKANCFGEDYQAKWNFAESKVA
jgi:hypothetical protein